MTSRGGSRGRTPAVARLRTVRAQWALLLGVLLAALAALHGSDLMWRADLALYDAAMRGGPAPADVVIVAIDDASLASLGRWPWPRRVHAALLERLREAGVRGVALDVIFTEAEADDATLASALAAGPPTVLPLIAEPAVAPGGAPMLLERRPVAALAAAAVALGHAHVEIDRDGVARSVFLREGRGRPQHPHFALALLGQLAPGELAPPRGERHPDLAGAPRDAWVRDWRLMIPFLGPPGHFTTLSYAAVLDGRVDAAQLRGRWVLVGATAQGLGDAYATPLSRDGRTTAGVEFAANVLQALRAGNGIVVAPAPLRLLFGALPLLAAFAGFLLLTPRRSLLLLALLWLATLAASALALRFTSTWWPPAAALAVLTLAYPLWNWRRLEATQRFLEQEFSRLMAERTPLARDPALMLAAADGGDPLQRRIDLVDAATTRVRDLRRLLADAISNLPDAVLVIDLDGRIVLASPAAHELLGDDADASGITRDGALASGSNGSNGRNGGTGATGTTGGTSLLDAALAGLLDARFGPGSVAAESLAQGPAAIELRTRPRPGERPRDLLLRIAPFVDDAGQRLGTLVSFADVTALRDVQREREDLVRFLSHDLRSPVTSLLALVELQRDPARALSSPQLATRVETLARRVMDLADGFLALARAEALDRADFEELDLRDAVQDAVDEAWAAARLADVGLRIEAPTPAPVRGNRGLLARAAINLLRNAIRFAPARTEVRVQVGAVDGWLELRVIDAGPGVDPSLDGRLFERFQRGPEAPSPTASGHGLGLALVRVVATRHGGEAGVRPGRPDPAGQPTGSEFFLRLRRAPDEPRAAHDPR